MFTWIQLKIGDGRSCRFWTDNWFPMGRVADFMLQGRNTRLGIRKDATLASLCREGQWLIPQARSENQVAVLAFHGLGRSGLLEEYQSTVSLLGL